MAEKTEISEASKEALAPVLPIRNDAGKRSMGSARAKRSYDCSNCKQLGHNRSSCNSAPAAVRNNEMIDLNVPAIAMAQEPEISKIPQNNVPRPFFHSFLGRQRNHVNKEADHETSGDGSKRTVECSNSKEGAQNRSTNQSAIMQNENNEGKTYRHFQQLSGGWWNRH